MELKDRFDILKQSALIVQKKGVLSLDDAVYTKHALDCIENNSDLDIALKILINVVTLGQSKGCFTLKDAYLIFVALNGIEDLLPKEDSDENKKGED